MYEITRDMWTNLLGELEELGHQGAREDYPGPNGACLAITGELSDLLAFVLLFRETAGVPERAAWWETEIEGRLLGVRQEPHGAASAFFFPDLAVRH